MRALCQLFLLLSAIALMYTALFLWDCAYHRKHPPAEPVSFGATAGAFGISLLAFIGALILLNRC